MKLLEAALDAVAPFQQVTGKRWHVLSERPVPVTTRERVYGSRGQHLAEEAAALRSHATGKRIRAASSVPKPAYETLTRDEYRAQDEGSRVPR